MCQRCGSREPGRRFAVDGTDTVVCASCIHDDIRIAATHDQIRAIHRAAHGHDAPCPTCAADSWLAHQRILEQLETSRMLATLGRQPLLFDAEGTLIERPGSWL